MYTVLDDTVEPLLVKKHGHKAAFGSTPSLYNRQLRSIEKIGFQGQSAAKMGVIMTCYTQKALGILLENLQSENPNIDRAIQTTRDVFAMTTKSLDQVARAGAFHHMSRRKAAVYDTGLDEYKDYASTIMALPLTSEGVFGSQFDDKLKSKQERFKQIAEVLPELDNSNRNAKSVAGKRKAALVTAMTRGDDIPTIDRGIRVTLVAMDQEVDRTGQLVEDAARTGVVHKQRVPDSAEIMLGCPEMPVGGR